MSEPLGSCLILIYSLIVELPEDAQPPGNLETVKLEKTKDTYDGQTELKVREERPREKPDVVTMFDVTAKGNKLFIKRKVIERAALGQDEVQFCKEPNIQKAKKGSHGRKRSMVESNVHKSTREDQTQVETVNDKITNTGAVPEKVKNKIRECISSYKKFQEKAQDSDKIEVTQTPIKKLTSIISAVAEGENAHLLKKKQQDCPGNSFPAGHDLTRAENGDKTSSKSSNISTACNQQEQQTKRKVYEFRDRSIGTLNPDIEGCIKGTTNRNSCGSATNLQEKSSQHRLVNTYSCKNASQLNIGSIINNRKPSLQEKIAKLHRENCIVIPKLWKDSQKEDPKFRNSCEGVVPNALSAQHSVANFEAKEEGNQNYGTVALYPKIAQLYTIPLKKRKQY